MRHAFSLIELMVVVAILALLTAVAVPVYKDYTIRAKIASSIPILERLTKSVTERVNLEGEIPASVVLGGVTIASGVTVAATDLGPLINALLYSGEGVAGMGSGEFSVCVMYDTDVLGSSEIGRRLCQKVTIADTIETQCGNYSAHGTIDLFPEYFPAGCTCDGVVSC